MLERRTINENSTNAYYFVENILTERRDYALTKEEIYAELPKDERGIPYVTISGLETALRALCRAKVIEAYYVRGIRHFMIAEEQRGGYRG